MPAKPHLQTKFQMVLIWMWPLPLPLKTIWSRDMHPSQMPPIMVSLPRWMFRFFQVWRRWVLLTSARWLTIQAIKWPSRLLLTMTRRGLNTGRIGMVIRLRRILIPSLLQTRTLIQPTSLATTSNRLILVKVSTFHSPTNCLRNCLMAFMCMKSSHKKRHFGTKKIILSVSMKPRMLGDG